LTILICISFLFRGLYYQSLCVVGVGHLDITSGCACPCLYRNVRLEYTTISRVCGQPKAEFGKYLIITTRNLCNIDFIV